MTFEEALVSSGRLAYVVGDEVIDGNRVVAVYRLGEDETTELAWRSVPVAEVMQVEAQIGQRQLAKMQSIDSSIFFSSLTQMA